MTTSAVFRNGHGKNYFEILGLDGLKIRSLGGEWPRSLGDGTGNEDVGIWSQLTGFAISKDKPPSRWL